ncbi:cytochrome c oxidase subunit IV [Ancylostoma duodenale]|uniref:Cytochrome c oxidase subunit IV n=1 Tax=Ancylostoma duodenale TaxID=51022 RepID=A0A0C2G459_9BILA|nr:cytochrome c oxidase subunit IV [Ancylostoma duodenale]
MLSRNLVLPRLAVRTLKTSAPFASGHHLEHWWGPEKAAGRELVGFGVNGDNNYSDRLDYWYPAIRFRKEDDVIAPIRKKELADWKNLTLEEKKMLYRYSFKQTLAEFEAPSGYWKALFPPIPPTFQDEYKEAAVQRALILEKVFNLFN